MEFGSRRGTTIDINEELRSSGLPLSEEEAGHFDAFDLVYRSLCALLYNYVPDVRAPRAARSRPSRIVTSLLYDSMDYDLARSQRAPRQDLVSYAAGHKALGPLRHVGAPRPRSTRIAAPGPAAGRREGPAPARGPPRLPPESR
jgi:hypothetical protein